EGHSMGLQKYCQAQRGAGKVEIEIAGRRGKLCPYLTQFEIGHENVGYYSCCCDGYCGIAGVVRRTVVLPEYLRPKGAQPAAGVARPESPALRRKNQCRSGRHALRGRLPVNR